MFKGIVDDLIRPALLAEESPLAQLFGIDMGGGYRMDFESLSAFDDAIAEAVDVLREARPRVDCKARNSAEAKIRAKAARADVEFAAFVQSISAGGV